MAIDVDTTEDVDDVDSGDDMDDAQDESTPASKTFSEEEVNKREAALRKSVERKLAKAAKKREQELQAQINELQTKMLSSIGQPDDEDGEDEEDQAPSGKVPPWQAELKKLERKQERELRAKEERLERLQQELEAEKLQRRELLRQKLLDDGIAAAGGAVDRRGALRYFKDQIFWDDDEGEWLYRSDDGDTLDVVDGITRDMPDWLKPSKLRGSGSGTNKSTAPSGKTKTKTQLEAAEAELLLLEKAAKADGNASGPAVERWWAKKREIKRLKNELKDTK